MRKEILTKEDKEVISGIKDAIATLALNMTIGQTLTSTDIILKIKEVYPILALAGVQLSIDNESWTHQLEARPFQLFGFSSDHMLVSEP